MCSLDRKYSKTFTDFFDQAKSTHVITKKMSNAVSDKQLNARAQFMERNKACTC